jgi:hypothetical protein
MATREELAWAAGFFDGEGCVGAYAGPPSKGGVRRRYLRVSVAQKQRPLLDKYLGIFGCGAVYEDKRRPMHAYQASGRAAFDVVNRLWPWLGEQKRADFKRACRMIAEARVTADEALKPAARECGEPDCTTVFTPDRRHAETVYCSTRCFQRINARRKRGPAPPKFCLGCRCPVDDRTRGCLRCSKRHWQRRYKRGD